jgi:hypothetical protein
LRFFLAAQQVGFVRFGRCRFLRTSTWMVRALPLESACLISLVDLRVSVIFLRSALATVPCEVRR